MSGPPGRTVSDHVVAAVDLVKRFGATEVLRGVSFTLQRGETLVIMGGSGSGKTVLLRTVAGLIRADSGSLRVFGIDITPLSEEELLPVRRRMGYVFQGAALFDSLTVYDNVAFPLREHTNLPAPEIRRRVVHVLSLVGLGEDVLPKVPSERWKPASNQWSSPHMVYSYRASTSVNPSAGSGSFSSSASISSSYSSSPSAGCWSTSVIEAHPVRSSRNSEAGSTAVTSR